MPDRETTGEIILSEIRLTRKEVREDVGNLSKKVGTLAERTARVEESQKQCQKNVNKRISDVKILAVNAKDKANGIALNAATERGRVSVWIALATVVVTTTIGILVTRWLGSL